MAKYSTSSIYPLVTCRQAECRGTQQEYGSKPLKHSIVECLLVFKQ